MPTMIRESGKAKKIHERIMGSPRNEHKAYSRDPQIRDADKQRVMLALMNNMSNGGNNENMPQDNQGMM